MADSHGTEPASGGAPPEAPPATVAGPPPLVGQSVLRSEDRRFLTGAGRYLDDLAFPGEAQGRRPQVAPRPRPYRRASTPSSAASSPGVVAVLTGADVVADGVPPLPCWIRIPLKEGTTQAFPDRPILAVGKVRFVGDPVALVVAETLDQARDAAERIVVDYEPLPAVTDLAGGDRTRRAPRSTTGTRQSRLRTSRPATRTADRCRLRRGRDRRLPRPRQQSRRADSAEPRGAIGAFSDAEGYTLHVSSQGSHWLKDTLTGYILKDVPPER